MLSHGAIYDKKSTSSSVFIIARKEEEHDRKYIKLPCNQTLHDDLCYYVLASIVSRCERAVNCTEPDIH